MSAASLHLISGAPVAQGNNIPLSPLVGLLTGPGNSAPAILSCVDLRLTVVVHIRLLSTYHNCTGIFDAPVATAAAML